MNILSISCIHQQDSSPDLSFIGTYTNIPKPNSIPTGATSAKEYKYFTPEHSDEDSGCPGSAQADFERMQAYNRSEWYMLGIRFEAKVQLTKAGPIQKLSSMGLWGIESDSDPAYFGEVKEEEKAGLFDELKAIGFSDEAIHKAFQAIERKN